MARAGKEQKQRWAGSIATRGRKHSPTRRAACFAPHFQGAPPPPGSPVLLSSRPRRRQMRTLLSARGLPTCSSSPFETTIGQLDPGAGLRRRTISASVFISSSGEMKALCTRNLSLHLAWGGGSCARGWRMTGEVSAWCHVGRTADDPPCTSTLSPASTRPEFGLTQYCLGAVVLTLKATGEEWGLWMRRLRLTV
jgi:hypothetical protein